MVNPYIIMLISMLAMGAGAGLWLVWTGITGRDWPTLIHGIVCVGIIVGTVTL